MADLSDVENALAEHISASLYPAGARGLSLTGAVCRVYRGWPVSASLEADLARGVVNISVFSLPGGRTTTRWATEYSGTPALRTLQVVVSGNTATFSGNAGPGQLAGLLVGMRHYTHRTRSGDTPDTVAAALGLLAGPDQEVVVQGACLVLPDTPTFVARTGADASSTQELRRQEQRIRVSIWSDSPRQRDLVASMVDLGLAAIDFLPLPDGSTARMRADGGAVMDNQEAAGLYRRDLVCTAEYSTIQVLMQPSMLFGGLSLDQHLFIS